ncbi:transglutaminase-like domain-containing protein [Maritimibacter alkaliphilus]|uniref:transglutaminase-like domain-containing protein n=1 Tax=Maritimibacter alkaliphilus TaxID=404236 RepID=UPI0021BDAFB1|nr:transglutaminase family protein [Maritimibacter alkaliphilus]
MLKQNIRIQLGCDFRFLLPQATPMIAMLNVHATRIHDLEGPDLIGTWPTVPLSAYHDSFGNWCVRFVAPAGEFRIGTRTIISDCGALDVQPTEIGEQPVEALPNEVMQFLLGSRYCETDILSEVAWRLFENTPRGGARVQAICDFVHDHIRFDYASARATRSATQAYAEGKGVCRDYAHLAITFCRCMNIPARYCTGYLGDIGIEPRHEPGDFSAWMEVWLDGAWWVFDPRNNTPRIGRVLVARGRDASDVPMIHTFGANQLVGFGVVSDQLS